MLGRTDDYEKRPPLVFPEPNRLKVGGLLAVSNFKSVPLASLLLF